MYKIIKVTLYLLVSQGDLHRGKQKTMADELDVEAMLEAPYKKEVCCAFYF